LGAKGFFPGPKRPKPENDHSPTASVEIKNEQRCSSPPARLHRVQKDKFMSVFTFTQAGGLYQYVPVDAGFMR